MQNAYREGRTILQNAANINALNSVMTATKISPKHEEFAITGTHSNRVHHNSEGLIRGFIRNGEVKSVQPVYSNGENTLFHSHPSLSPISKNPSGNPKFRVAGDIGHSYYGKRIYLPSIATEISSIQIPNWRDLALILMIAQNPTMDKFT